MIGAAPFLATAGARASAQRAVTGNSAGAAGFSRVRAALLRQKRTLPLRIVGDVATLCRWIGGLIFSLQRAGVANPAFRAGPAQPQ